MLTGLTVIKLFKTTNPIYASFNQNHITVLSKSRFYNSSYKSQVIY